MSHNTPTAAGGSPSGASLGATSGADRFEQVSALLGRYPDVTRAEIADLKSWFLREGSALDVALLASRDEIRRGYRAFRADHLDGMTMRDIVIGIAVIALLICAVAFGWAQ